MMTSGRNDYSACSTWLVHKNDAYLVHVYRGRLEYPDLRRKVIGLAAEHCATTVLIEDAGPGMNLFQGHDARRNDASDRRQARGKQGGPHGGAVSED
jgi:phage terminase large subunit-like protein